MANSSYIIHASTNLECTNVTPITIGVPLQKGDSKAHVIQIALSKNGEEYNPPSGATVSGEFKCPKSSPTQAGTISGNVCTVEFPSSVYTNAGEVVVAVRLTDSTSTVTIAKVYAYVIGDV